MDPKKRQPLQKKGWESGTVQNFLGLTDEENTVVEIRARLALALLELRSLGHLTQTEIARRGSSQSRVAKMEAQDPTVSLDLLIRTLSKLGLSMQTVGAILAEKDGALAAGHLKKDLVRARRAAQRSAGTPKSSASPGRATAARR
ncbi:MAG: XRE family transcriptional regulator [Deltaproteobacteria bacterium]|nr:XRE family transcriptional regulator [Deltaproteobacteria bacterium]